MGYSGQDVVNALQDSRKQLFEAVDNWRRFGHKLALAERDYRIAYRAVIGGRNADTLQFVQRDRRK